MENADSLERLSIEQLTPEELHDFDFWSNAEELVLYDFLEEICDLSHEEILAMPSIAIKRSRFQLQGAMKDITLSSISKENIISLRVLHLLEKLRDNRAQVFQEYLESFKRSANIQRTRALH